MSETEWLNLRQCCEHTGMSDRWLRELIARGDLPAYRVRNGRAIRVKRSDLDLVLFERISPEDAL